MRQKPAKCQLHAREESSGQSESAPPILRQPAPVSPAKPDDSEQARASISAEQVEELAFLGLEVAAIAILLECSPSQLTNQFAAALARGRARQQQFLLEKLADRIDANEWQALRFALKNACGMADHPEQAALQRQKLIEARERQGACSETLEPLRTPGELGPLAEDTGVELSPATTVTAALPAKPPGKVRPRFPKPAETGGEHA